MIREVVCQWRVTSALRGAHITLITDADVEIHDTESIDCWCSPRYLKPCDECETGCWKCERGVIPLTREEAEACDDPIIVVHEG